MKQYLPLGLYKVHAIAVLVACLFLFTIQFVSAESVPIGDLEEDDLCTELTKPMSYGSRDRYTNGEVTKLQRFLAAFEYLQSQPTGYFGTLTKGAVIKFQREHSIDPIGSVGRLTRAKIAEVSCNPDISDGEDGGLTVVPPAAPGTPVAYVGSGCKLSGCNSELCVDSSSEQVASTCAIRPEFACYRSARCEKQTSGRCGWTQSTALTQCLASGGASTNTTSSGGANTNQTNTGSNTNTSSTAIPPVGTVTTGNSSGTCAAGTVTWLDDSSITVQVSGTHKLLTCSGNIPRGDATGTYVVGATGGGNTTNEYWVTGYGRAKFTCVSENGRMQWKTTPGNKICSQTAETNTTTNSTQTGNQSNTNTNTNVSSGCVGSLIRGCTLPNRESGATSVAGSCGGGFTGSCSYSCSNGVWSPVSQCTPSTGPWGSITLGTCTIPVGQSSCNASISWSSGSTTAPLSVYRSTNGACGPYATADTTRCRLIGNGGSLAQTAGVTVPLWVGDNTFIMIHNDTNNPTILTTQRKTMSAPGTGTTGTTGVTCPWNQTLSWTVNGNTCTAQAPSGIGPTVQGELSDLTAPTTGSAQFTCQANGTWNETPKSGTATCTSGGGQTPTGQPPTNTSNNRNSCGSDGNYYVNGQLSQVCPKAPNGGISCDANVTNGGCAGEGKVWINGKREEWRGNTSGSCFASSACERGHECSTTTYRCTPRVQWSNEYGVTPPPNSTGSIHKRTWSGSDWGAWTFVRCDTNYHETTSGRCESNTRACTTSSGSGTQLYIQESREWAACAVNTPNITCNGATPQTGNRTVSPLANAGDVWGTGPFTSDSNLASIAAFLGGTGNSVTLNITDAGCRNLFQSGTAHGVTTRGSSGAWRAMTVTCVSGCNTSGQTNTGGTQTSSTGAASLGYISSTGVISSSNGLQNCVIPAGGSSCDVTVSWTTTNATNASLYKPGNSTALTSGLTARSYKFENLTPIMLGGHPQFVLEVQPGSVQYSGGVGAVCASGSTWNGTSCASNSQTTSQTTQSVCSAVGILPWGAGVNNTAGNECVAPVNASTVPVGNTVVIYDTSTDGNGYTGSATVRCSTPGAANPWSLVTTSCSNTSNTASVMCGGPTPPSGNRTVSPLANAGDVWGTGPFTSDSNLASIAAYLGGTGSSVTLNITDAGCRSNFLIGTANGVTTKGYAGSWRAMTVSCVSGCR